MTGREKGDLLIQATA